MPEASDMTGWLVFWVVAGARFLIPLTIPRFPLPGILVSLILDGIDQTIFQQFPGLKLEGYQGYDKALDIYYLSIAYISTMRNWENHFAFQVSRFLFYWRLVGVALFELTHIRALLIIFPNTFEYFFIFYEIFRLRWNPERMTKKIAIGGAAAIWIVIKLPQEYWIHIAQTDTTDWIKTSLFKVPLDTPWGQIMRTWPWVFILAIAVMTLVVVGITWMVRNRFPPADYRWTFSADLQRPQFSTQQVRAAIAEEARQIVDGALIEKVVLTSLVALSFAQVLSEVRASSLMLVLGVGAIVIVNTTISHWIARRRFGWGVTIGQFWLLAAVNTILILGYSVIRTALDQPVRVPNAFFFVLLLTLLLTLFDRYRQIYLIRFGSQGTGRPYHDVSNSQDSLLD